MNWYNFLSSKEQEAAVEVNDVPEVSEEEEVEVAADPGEDIISSKDWKTFISLHKYL